MTALPEAITVANAVHVYAFEQMVQELDRLHGTELDTSEQESLRHIYDNMAVQEHLRQATETKSLKEFHVYAQPCFRHAVRLHRNQNPLLTDHCLRGTPFGRGVMRKLITALFRALKDE